MEADATWIVDKVGIERGGCCLSITLRDYARLGMFMDEGVVPVAMYYLRVGSKTRGRRNSVSRISM
jgi:hypothetical protein